MKLSSWLILAALSAFSSGWVSAQTPTPAPSQTAPDAAKIADFEKRFAQGKQLEQDGKLTEARAVFDGILAEDPDAKGSLREAGIVSVGLHDLPKANQYFEKLNALVPDYPAVIESLIQINQALGRDVKVETLLKEFRNLHNSGKLPDFSKSLYFVRERMPSDQNSVIVISEFFDYKQEPHTMWMAKKYDADGHLVRWLLLNYDPDATMALRGKDPKYASTEIFTWYEHVLKDEKVKEVDVYLQIFALPDYKKFRSAMLTILANPPKPIYTQAVDASSQPQ